MESLGVPVVTCSASATPRRTIRKKVARTEWPKMEADLGGPFMPSFGYKISALYLTPNRKPAVRLAFDHQQFGTGGAAEAIKAALSGSATKEGQADDDTLHYMRLDKVSSNGWGHLVWGKGGLYGDAAEVVEVASGNPRGNIGAGDAVIREARVLFIVPPVGELGLMVSETRSRSHLTAAVLRELNKKLLIASGAKARLESEIADNVAWNGYFDQSDTRVSGVELVQHRRSTDDTRFTEEDVVRKSTVSLQLVDGSEVQRGIRGAIDGFRGQQQQQRPRLAELVGLRAYGDDAFDEQRLILVQDGKERRINVDQGWPSFTYAIDADEQLDDDSFLATVRSASEDTLGALGVDLPASGWWPDL
jgi:hypothetical protein